MEVSIRHAGYLDLLEGTIPTIRYLQAGKCLALPILSSLSFFLAMQSCKTIYWKRGYTREGRMMPRKIDDGVN